MKRKRQQAKKRRRPRSGASDPLEAAMRLHQSGQLVKAEKAYRRVLAADPDSPRAHYLCGVVTRQLGHPQQAIDLLRRAVALRPDHLEAISELAQLCQETGQLRESAEVLRRLIALRPDIGDLYNNLGVVLKRMGDSAEAVIAYEKAVELSPDSAEAHFNLGSVLKAEDRFQEAAAAFRRAIAAQPDMTDAYRSLAASLRSSGEVEEAGDVLRQWLGREPDNPVARHMVAAHFGEDDPTRASDEYVRKVFDDFAASFDDDLRTLDYQGPRLIAEAVTAEVGETGQLLDVLDAGCGTGLGASSLRRYSRRLVGVDLSAEMIERARKLKSYDDLAVGELTEYLNNHPQVFDLITAADAFNYFGALEPLFAAASCALRDQRLLVFTLEQSDQSASSADYRLNLSGRYSHNEDYVERCMQECQLTILSMEHATLRQEKGRPVIGLVVRARK